MIKASVYSRGAVVWVSSTSFQKKWHWLASPASKRKVAKIQRDFHDYVKKLFFSKHHNLSLNHRIQEPGWLWSPQKWFSRPKKPLQPHWPQQPQQPHWPHQPHQPYFLQEIPGHDGLIIPGTKMTNTGPCLWNRSSKIQFFTDILYLFCWKLLRSGYVTFLKTGWWNSNDRTSGIHRWLYHYQKVVFRWPLRSSKYIKAIWKTLYKHSIGSVDKWLAKPDKSLALLMYMS